MSSGFSVVHDPPAQRNFEALAALAPLLGGVELEERTDPDAPVTNRGRVYLRDNGSGKSQLVVRFPTGAIQVLATEP